MSKKILIIIVLTLAAFALVLPGWAGPVPVSVIPDGARWIAHLDVQKFVATKLFDYLEKDGRLEIRDRDLTHRLKIDPFKDITGLTVFGLGPGDKQAVFAVAGRFDKARLLTLLDLVDEEHQEVPYGGFTIYVTTNGHDVPHGYGAFVNDGLIVYAENRTAIERVLDAAAGKAKDFSSSSLYGAFKNLPAGAFLSGVTEDLTGLDRDIRKSKIAEAAKGLLFTAQEKGDNFQVRLQVTTDSPESAKNMADIVQGFIALGRMSQGEGRRGIPASLTSGLQVKTDGNVVRLELDMPSREVVDLTSGGRHRSFFD
jgi:hypothetical protein